ncbi:hypothetical protein BDU57DRAFT_503823 [Ampelomyces quisqualis]|uniref:Cyclin-dependent kinase n=1 Tax=Ampelomyces quisqualis TaxID=50730 RepID=A0A6A5QE23_AMPQU|nr:hypothetical protein BDU57DRAFT_503823 [Ampelomyces quisqualis]
MSPTVDAYYPATLPVSASRKCRWARSLLSTTCSPIAPPDTRDTTHAPAATAASKPDLPASQESLCSAVSSTFSAPKLPSSSSNLSTSTTTDADPPSPPSTHVAAAAAASPMPPGSPAAQGFKRTADGALKGEDKAAAPPGGRPFAYAHKRNKSMDTHRIGEVRGPLSAQLKTRLSYAMVKVQNGWEKQSLDELEEVHSQRGSPNSAPGRTDRLAFGSPSTFPRQRRPSGVSDNSDPMLMSPASDPSGAHLASSSSYWRTTSRPTLDAAANLISVTGAQHGLRLAPAPEIQPGRRRRSSASHPPPPLLGAGQRKHSSDMGAGPRTPATPRAGILRMPSQQAEKDAVDTLLFMSSPNNSQRFPHTSQTAPSPLRADAPQRRVMFDAYPPQERRIVYQPQMPPPQHHYGHYAAHPAR